jgi:hypothetical protein
MNPDDVLLHVFQEVAMPSPFPGMDPYLEGYLWPDVHSALAHKIRQQLAPQIQPDYVARIEISVVEDESFAADIGVMYPDVEVIKTRRPEVPVAEPMGAERVITAAPMTLSLPEVRLTRVEIRDVAQNQLVTGIEIISPVNKREPHLSRYRQKRDRMRQAGVHLLEIDLLRRGTRVWEYAGMPDNVPYLAVLTRAGARQIDIWPMALQNPLPVLPVPLRPPHGDVALALQAAISELYDEAYYHLSIDYHQEPPPPEFSATEREWMRRLFV